MSSEIGKYCCIADDVEFGENVVVYGFANLYGCRIGDGCRIGAFVEIQCNTILGKRVRIQSHTFICSDVTVGDDVFIGHNVSFINDRYPTARKASSGTWKCEGIIVDNGVSIGSGSVIMCGIRIGEGAVIGAGSVIVSDVPAHSVIAGVPGRLVRILSKEERWLGGQSVQTVYDE